jgi:N-acyl-D-amino-acid deacylase
MSSNILLRSFRVLVTAIGIASACACAAQAPNTSSAAEPQTLIVNARIVDGSGKPAYTGSVRIRGQRIVAVGQLRAQEDETVVDAEGLVLAPGFIDTHSHHDRGLFEHLDALPVVSQGVTTIVVGQDGGSEPIGELFDRMAKTPPAINVATYVGHNTVREVVMGKDFKRHATAGEVARMADLVRQGMEQGALGLSSGLEYDPGIFSDPSEVLALAKVAASYGGRYISHIRSEDRWEWEALEEIINIGRVTKMPVQVSHMKLAMVDWWGQADKFIGIMDKARAEGVNITGDVYPYEYWHSDLTVLFPKRDFTNRKTAEFVLKSIAPADGLILATFSPEPALVNHSIAEIAKMRGTDAATTLMALIAESEVPGAEESVMGKSMREDDIAKLIAWPQANICSDGELDGGHPRGYGTFPRVLRMYVRESHLLTLEQAIHKMSAEAAEHVGIRNRGHIDAGQYADLVLLDPATVTDRATMQDPHALSTGIEKVWVNGAVVFEDGHATGAHSGLGLKRATDKQVQQPVKEPE